MPTKHRRNTTGPLNERQRQILPMLAKGLSHMVIAGRLGISRTCVSENAAVIFNKMQCKNTAEVCYQYGRAQGLREAAEINDTYLIPNPIDDIERQTNEGTRAVSRILRQRADGILP